MCFDRNINGNMDVEFLQCDYIFACATMRKTHFRNIVITLDLMTPQDLYYALYVLGLHLIFCVAFL